MADANTRPSPGPRAIAIVGPYLSGKTTLLESILWTTGTTDRKGSVTDGNTVGDSSPEARAHQMSVEANVATTTFIDDRLSFIDCPGSVEFLQETLNTLCAVDAAIVVCEPDTTKIVALQPYLRYLHDANVPHMLFVNKIDTASGTLRDLLAALQPASQLPLVMRQVPIWEGGIATGYIDLALERAYVYREHTASEVVDIPEQMAEREKEARYTMLEQLADYDDGLMEELLEDIEPPNDEVFDNLTRDFREAKIVPVFLGSAEGDNGVRRLLKALRHETPSAAETAARLTGGDVPASLMQILKTYNTAHGGKLSVTRVLAGKLDDGDTLYRPDGADERASGVYAMLGGDTRKIDSAIAGDTVAIGRLESMATGDTLSTDKNAKTVLARPEVLSPVYDFAVDVAERKDEVKLTGAIHKIQEEDPSIILDQIAEMHEMLMRGQGEMHLRVAIEKLKNRYGLSVTTRRPRVPYMEAIRKPITQRGRHKRQSGGHGQFGDVVLDIKPLPRGSGFQFEDKITGGVVPRQYIPSVEAGVKDYLQSGPLGFPVVDVAVTLVDGSYHSVDSSDQAFRTAGRVAMQEALPQCSPVLLEPVLHVEIAIPSEATAKVNAIVSSRRGQILGFDARDGWPGWDQVEAQIPQSEIHDLIIELRSATHGVGAFTYRFDHLQELTGKLADQVLEKAKAA